ncbi:transcriptional regulator [Flavobacterium macrobrachii]|uniref:Transcriptional regulator n=1 Tax=Flavobacterium macrobrachii TaxID=591204 RepID=A0ABS2CT72_9FLAO|nr:transcriptional regulator [Flavobacterium macrobrachii]MBM6498106.1 transcriptional regulator [Flavobacterium macrobrachii]
MNYIKHLTGFFEKVAIDKTLNPTHVSLYIALFQFWNCNRFKNPISINRDEVMRISKISSKATYHKCLKNLHSLGYINYEPSYNPFKGSHVILFNFSEDLKPLPKSERKPKNEPLNELVSEQALNKSCTSSETGTEQAVVPSINYINNTNILNDKNVSNLEKLTKNFEEINNSNLENENSKEEKSSAKKEEKLHPLIEEVKTYFQENNFPEQEAQKFFNYFKSVGWLVGGKIPMVDWQAAAQNWMINAPKFISNAEQPNRAKQLNTTTDKDYSEPL